MIQSPLQKSVFSLYLLLILTLRKASYYPSSTAKNEVLGVKKEIPTSNVQISEINDLQDAISQVRVLYPGDGKTKSKEKST
jgi:hypothetical protein